MSKTGERWTAGEGVGLLERRGGGQLQRRRWTAGEERGRGRWTAALERGRAAAAAALERGQLEAAAALRTVAASLERRRARF
jgi:hypothetical protein